MSLALNQNYVTWSKNKLLLSNIHKSWLLYQEWQYKLVFYSKSDLNYTGSFPELKH